MAKVVFMGTPEFAVPPLRALLAHHDVIGVITQPDRPAGRGRGVTVSPVKAVALESGVPIFQPHKIRRPEAIAELKQMIPDLYIVAAFGQILPQTVLDIPPHGSVNIHASLLPRWRGAAPIHAAVRAGDAESGVTIMKMDAGLDTGPMIRARAIPIESGETGQSLHDKLAQLGADLLIETLPGYLDGSLVPVAQPEDGVTIAPRIAKEEGRIDWNQPAIAIERLIRAFTPWPGTFTTWNGQIVKILSASVLSGSAQHGRVVRRDSTVAIGTGDGLIAPTRVQLEGRSAAAIEDFVRGYPAFVDTVLV